MKNTYLSLSIFFLTFLFHSRIAETTKWIIENRSEYKLHFTETDKKYKDEYLLYIDTGIKSVQKFFGATFKKEFAVYIHPDRNSLDSQWRKDWKIPDFKSECRMVASGVSDRLDMISPGSWDKESCEHSFSDKKGIQQIITHELVHVFHGQQNISPDFSNTEGIDWFAEGLATYASGQLDSSKIVEIKKAVSEKKFPDDLNSFWTGKLRYGLSGSMVMYLDNKFGRAKLIELLKFNKKDEVLKSLGITEVELLNRWVDYIRTL